jgi:hypothetical protein
VKRERPGTVMLLADGKRFIVVALLPEPTITDVGYFRFRGLRRVHSLADTARLI